MTIETLAARAEIQDALLGMRHLDRFERRDRRWAIADRTVGYERARKDTMGGWDPRI